MNSYHHKYYSFIGEYLNNLNKPNILEFGVGEGITTKIFLEVCEHKNGSLVSVDVEDYSSKFSINNWTFLKCRDDNYEIIKEKIIGKLDVILLDTLHNPKHIQKMINEYFKYLKIGGIFLIDGISWLPYLKKEKRNSFSGEVIMYENFRKILEIYYNNIETIDLEFSFQGSGVAKLIKLKEKELIYSKKIIERILSIKNTLRIIKNNLNFFK
jgi:predicted O-methyltransferase YrrM